MQNVNFKLSFLFFVKWKKRYFIFSISKNIIVFIYDEWDIGFWDSCWLMTTLILRIWCMRLFHMFIELYIIFYIIMRIEFMEFLLLFIFMKYLLLFVEIIFMENMIRLSSLLSMRLFISARVWIKYQFNYFIFQYTQIIFIYIHWINSFYKKWD